MVREREEREQEKEKEGDTESVAGSTGSGISRASWNSRGSRWSMTSRVSLSEGEVMKIKETLRKEDWENRKKNIIIRGAGKLNGDDLKKSMEEFLKEKLGVEVKMESAWMSGSIYVGKLEKEEDKRAVLVNKGKLRDTRIFIDHDLSYEERARQTEIQKWVYNKRERGENAKIGLGKVWINGKWVRWEHIKEQEEREEEQKDRNVTKKNFQ